MPTEAQLVDALTRADAAGDTASAQQFAGMIKQMRGASTQAAPQQSPQDRARAAGQVAGGDQGGLIAGIRGAASSGTFGLSDYVNAGARYLAQRATGVPNPDDFSTDVAFSKGLDEGSSAAHPVAHTVGAVAGALVPGEALARGTVAATRLGGALALKAGQPIGNLMRVIGHGAIGGGAYGAVAGGAQSAENGGSAGDIASSAAAGGAEGATVGAVTGAAGAGVTKGLQVAVKQFRPVAQRAIAVLADKLDMEPAKVGQMLTDFRKTTGRAPTIADILSAKDAANVEPITTQYQPSASNMLDAQQANQAALPGRMASRIAQGGPTPTPFDGADLSTARVGDLRNSQNAIMSDVMGDKADPTALRNQPVGIGQQEAALLDSPIVRDAVRGDTVLRAKLAGLHDPAQPQTLSVDDFERLRQALRGQQTARMSPNSPRYSPQAAGDYGQTADALSDLAAQQHPDYGGALKAYAAQERFIGAFQHGSAGKSIHDEPDMGDIRSFDTPEGRAGLELGARSRLVQNAGETEGGALKTADTLRQGAPSKTLESLPAAEAADLQRVGAAESTSQQNYSQLAPSRLSSKDKDAGRALQSGLEGAAAVGGHTLTGFKTHAVYRLLAQRGVRESTANEIVSQLTRTRSPADVAQLTTMLNRERGLGADARRLILKQAQRFGAGGAAASQPFADQSQ